MSAAVLSISSGIVTCSCEFLGEGVGCRFGAIFAGQHVCFTEVISEVARLVQAIILSSGHTVRVPLKLSPLRCDREGRIAGTECCGLSFVPRLSGTEVLDCHLTPWPAMPPRAWILNVPKVVFNSLNL